MKAFHLAAVSPVDASEVLYTVPQEALIVLVPQESQDYCPTGAIKTIWPQATSKVAGRGLV